MLFLGCTPPIVDSAVEETAIETADTQESGDTADTGDTGTGPECAPNTVAVGSLCFDPYEVVLTGELGALDQFLGSGPVTEVLLVSEEGRTPTEAVTFSQAWTACEQAGGRLPTNVEWQDAADGVLGEGGTLFPYGDEFDEAACITTAQDNTQQHEGAQPSGSAPRCHSEFAVYDLIGNVWEWTAAPGRMDPEAWLDVRNIYAEDGWLFGNASIVTPMATGIGPPVLHTANDGRLYAKAEQLDQVVAQGRRGYLRDSNQGFVRSADELLPFELVQEEEGGPAYARVIWEAAGLPVPDKSGCAWYTGEPWRCTAEKQDVAGHFHDFQGTIGFRCISDPVEG